MQCVLGGEQQDATGTRHSEAAQTWDAGGVTTFYTKLAPDCHQQSQITACSNLVRSTSYPGAFLCVAHPSLRPSTVADMAARRFNDPIEPMDLTNMRQNGVRSLLIFCRNCHHEKIINVDHLPGDLSVPSLGRRLACTKCGTGGADVRPNWKERSLDETSSSTSVSPTPLARGRQ